MKDVAEKKYCKFHSFLGEPSDEDNCLECRNLNEDEGIRRSAEIARKRPFLYRMKTVTSRG